MTGCICEFNDATDPDKPTRWCSIHAAMRDALEAKDAEIKRLMQFQGMAVDLQKENAKMQAVVKAARKHLCSEWVKAGGGHCEICNTLAALDDKP